MRLKLLSIALCCWASTATADYVVLRTGGRLAGEIVPNVSGELDPRAVTVKTLSGAVVSVARDQIESVHRRKLAYEEYDRKEPTVEKSVEAQLAMADWCKQNGLTNQRVIHLRKVIEIDPEHAATRKALGYTRHGSEWMSQDEIMRSKGFVKNRGKWILPQELAMIEQAAQDNEAERQWFKPVKMWYNWVNSDDPAKQSEGLQKLKNLREGEAAPAVIRTFQKAPTEPLRLLLVEILSKIESPRAVEKLIDMSLWEELISVRAGALQGVKARRAKAAIPVYVRALRNERNLIVNRAGAALAQVGDDSAVAPLIEALVTRHQYKIQVPENVVGMTGNGQWVQSIDPTALPPEVAGMLATGQLPKGVVMDYHPNSAAKPRMRTVVMRYDEKNVAVLDALTLLTGENFGFDEPAWRRWRSTQQSTIAPAKSRKGS